MKHVARACLAVAPLIWACSYYDYEGMGLASPVDRLVVGDTVGLSVVAHDGSMPPAASVAWTSSDTAIAAIDELGVVSGIGPGWAVIEARTGDYTLKIPLLVLATAGPFVSVDAGIDHGCGLEEDGRAWCWGSNEYNQLGHAFGPDRCYTSPGEELGPSVGCSKGAIPVDTDLSFTRLATGFHHTCGVTSDGTAYCWGLNDRGQLGDGGTETRPTPVSVAGTHAFESLAAGGRTACGITEDDALLCWGGGLVRVDGTSVDELTTPTHVAAEHRFALAATNGSHTCGVTTAGATYCWGLNSHGQLGVESVDSICGSSPCTPEPQEVSSAPPFVDLAVGPDFSCGLTAGGAAYCWGGNERGQLGDGTRTGRWEAMPVAGGHAFTRLEADRDRACGLDGAGLLHCWGRDRSGFGNGGDPVEVDEPVPGAARLTFTEITIGLSSQCGVAPSGVTWCWGSNFKATLGNGRADRIGVTTTPTRVVQHPVLY